MSFTTTIGIYICETKWGGREHYGHDCTCASMTRAYLGNHHKLFAGLYIYIFGIIKVMYFVIF